MRTRRSRIVAAMVLVAGAAGFAAVAGECRCGAERCSTPSRQRWAVLQGRCHHADADNCQQLVRDQLGGTGDRPLGDRYASIARSRCRLDRRQEQVRRQRNAVRAGRLPREPPAQARNDPRRQDLLQSAPRPRDDGQRHRQAHARGGAGRARAPSTSCRRARASAPRSRARRGTTRRLPTRSPPGRVTRPTRAPRPTVPVRTAGATTTASGRSSRSSTSTPSPSRRSRVDRCRSRAAATSPPVQTPTRCSTSRAVRRSR